MGLEIGIRSPREKNLLLLLADSPFDWEDFNFHEKYILYTSVIDITTHVDQEKLDEFGRTVEMVKQNKQKEERGVWGIIDRAMELIR